MGDHRARTAAWALAVVPRYFSVATAAIATGASHQSQGNLCPRMVVRTKKFAAALKTAGVVRGPGGAVLYAHVSGALAYSARTGFGPRPCADRAYKLAAPAYDPAVGLAAAVAPPAGGQGDGACVRRCVPAGARALTLPAFCAYVSGRCARPAAAAAAAACAAAAAAASAACARARAGGLRGRCEPRRSANPNPSLTTARPAHRASARRDAGRRAGRRAGARCGRASVRCVRACVCNGSPIRSDAQH
jgi:hypothetical protein